MTEHCNKDPRGCWNVRCQLGKKCIGGQATAVHPVAMVVPHEASVRLEWASVEAAHNAKPGPLYAEPAALAALRSMPQGEPVASRFQQVGETQHLHELNDAWLQHLPIGTPLFTNSRTGVGSDGLSNEDRAAMHFTRDQANEELLVTELNPVAWMHDGEGRVDVIHDAVKNLLLDQHDKGYSSPDYMHRPLGKVEHYTIPLYATPPTEAVRMSEAVVVCTCAAKDMPFGRCCKLAPLLSEAEVMAAAKLAGFNLEPTANMLYTVRGNAAQIFNLARAVEQATAARLGVKMGDV